MQKSANTGRNEENEVALCPDQEDLMEKTKAVPVEPDKLCAENRYNHSTVFLRVCECVCVRQTDRRKEREHRRGQVSVLPLLSSGERPGTDSREISPYI